MTIKELLIGQTVYATGTTSQTPKCTGSDFSSGCECPNGKTDDGTQCLVNKEGTLGINCSADQLVNNTCSWSINKTLGIRLSDPNPSPILLVQDITLAATSFVGTIIMVAMIRLGIQAVLKGADDSSAMDDIKGKIKNLAIGLLLVIASYTIIRLVQYIARGF